MDINMIITAVVLVAGLGLIIGLILAVASAVMAVPVDERVTKLTDALPGANCGACGYSGCEGYAKALADGSAKPGKCSPGGAATADALCEILGVASEGVELKTALVHCLGSGDNTDDKMIYQGITSCAAAAMLHGGTGSCAYGCIGLGDCERACPYGAITVCNKVARIDPAVCRGCSVCVDTCPKRIISFVPSKAQAVVRCSSCDKGGVTAKACKVGCIGCKKCEKACEFGAVTVKNFKAAVDSELCTGCGACVEVCPRGCITAFIP